MSDRIRIAVVDDHPLLRAGVAHVLAGDDGFEIVGQGSCADEALRIADEVSPNVMLLDVSMPGGGINAASEILKKYPAIKVIMLTISESQDDVGASLKAGAAGYILKGISGPDLRAAVKNVANGQPYVSSSLAMSLLTGDRATEGEDDATANLIAELSGREEQILKLLGSGASNKIIGNKLGIKETTVKHYMTLILQKLRARNRVEAALIAQRFFKIGNQIEE